MLKFLDDKLPHYFRLVFVYIGHCMLNLVDNFLLNLARPESPPIYGLIGLAPMELPDFQVENCLIFFSHQSDNLLVTFLASLAMQELI